MAKKDEIKAEDLPGDMEKAAPEAMPKDAAEALKVARPWTFDSFVQRFGPKNGPAVYNMIALAGGYFNPESEPATYRPDLG